MQTWRNRELLNLQSLAHPHNWDIDWKKLLPASKAAGLKECPCLSSYTHAWQGFKAISLALEPLGNLCFYIKGKINTSTTAI
jgi:hypothetical protein